MCGRQLCCSSFLNSFAPVSIKMAKTQSLSLNPAKISGMCGRLMCCLTYEHEFYEKATKNIPKNGKAVSTAHGKGKVVRQKSSDEDYLVDNPNRRCPTIDKARGELAYEPKIGIKEGLRRSLIWYAENREAAEA